MTTVTAPSEGRTDEPKIAGLIDAVALCCRAMPSIHRKSFGISSLKSLFQDRITIDGNPSLLPTSVS